MAEARGVGQRIDGGGLSFNAYARIYANVQPILTGTNPGRLDTAGQYLHFRYSGNLNLGARSGGNQTVAGGQPADFVENKIVVEFDAQSSFTLPFEGTLELIGGLGEWRFGMEVQHYIDPQFYVPELRTLATFLGRGAPFTIPNNHTFILGVNPTATVLLAGGIVLQPGTVLPGVNIMAGSSVTVGPSNTCILTGWRG